MKIILRTYDFIKSWKYYPIMKKYLEEKCRVKYPHSRLQYSLWHCKQGFLSDESFKQNKVKKRHVDMVWKEHEKFK